MESRPPRPKAELKDSLCVYIGQAVNSYPYSPTLLWVGLKKILTIVSDPRNVMSSQEVIDFIQSKISQRDENGELRLLSSIVEEVSPRLEENVWAA